MSIPEPISSWATTELLNACVSLLKKTLSFKDSLDIVKQQNNLIICKLDVILNSPYQEAIHHLKARNVEEASNCLIKAITYDRYNIPARLLYVQVLCLKGLFDVAVDYYWDLYCDFTLLTTVFPKKLYNIFRWYLTISDITFDENLKIRFGYKEESKKYNAVTVCVSRYGFISCWRKERTILGIDSPLEGISIYDWSGCKLVELSGDNPEVISLSINNVIYYIDGKCYLYDFKNNSNEPINASPFINIKIDWKLFSYLTISRHDLQSKLSKFGFSFSSKLIKEHYTVHNRTWCHGNNVSWDTEKSYICGYLYISKNDLLADRLSLSTEEYYRNLLNIYRHYLLHTTCCEELLTNTLLAYKDIEKYNCKMGYFSSDGLYDKDAIYYLAEWIKSNSELNAFVDDIDVKQFAFLIWEKLNRTAQAENTVHDL